MCALAYVDALNTTIGTATVDYQLACINSYAVSRACAQCINSIAAFNISVERQSLACIDSRSLLQISAILVCSCNSSIFFEFIGTILGNNICFGIFCIIILYTRQSGSEICLSLVNVCSSSALTCLVVKINTGSF